MYPFPIFESQTGKLHNYFEFYNPLEDSIFPKIEKLVSSINSEIPKVTGGKEFQEYRNSSIKWIPYNHASSGLYDILCNYVYEANNSYWNFSIPFSSDNIQYTEYYGSNKGKYDWHVDTIDKVHRKLSIVIQLSNPKEYEGGDLEIYNYSPGEKNIITKIRRKKGHIIVFPSYLFHRVTPVTKGIRKSLVWWVGGTSFR